MDVEELHNLFDLTPISTARDLSSTPIKTTSPINALADVSNTSLNQSTKREKSRDGVQSGCLPEILPFPSRFSRCVENAMEKGSVLPVRTFVIADIGAFFYGMTSHPKQGEYKRMALLTCKKFPELKDSNPTNYWVGHSSYLMSFIFVIVIALNP